MESDWLAEIRKLASENKILAIKRYREHTNVGLREAMEAVQALEHAPEAHLLTSHTVPIEIIRLLSMGQKIQAIKVYQEMTGVGLKEAKDAIDALTANKTI